MAIKVRPITPEEQEILDHWQRADNVMGYRRALPNVQDYVKEAYGAGYAETHPQAEALKQAIYAIFDVKSKRTAQKRYEKVMALRKQYVQETPAAVVIFDTLQQRWPTLVNDIESEIIPRTPDQDGRSLSSLRLRCCVCQSNPHEGAWPSW